MAKDLLRPIVHGVVSIAPDGMLTKAMQTDMWARLRYLRGLGFAPDQIVDVGAHDGHWSAKAAKLFAPAKLLMIEALDAKQEPLETLSRSLGERGNVHIGLLSAEDGQRVAFHEIETGSSMFRQIAPADGATTEKTTTTLDTVLKGKGIERVDFLKLDVQGAELAVLRGGARALTQVEVVLLELSVGDYNTGVPGAGEVISLLCQQGFILRDLADVNRMGRGKPVMQFDAIFVSARSRLYRT